MLSIVQKLSALSVVSIVHKKLGNLMSDLSVL